MKVVLATAAMLGLGISQAAAKTEFQGGLCVVAVSSACTADGWAVGNCFGFRYTPPNLSDNGPSTRLSLFTGGYSTNYTLASGTLIGTAFKPVVATSVSRGGDQYTGATMRIASQLPATLTATTTYVYFTGSITRWDEIVGCTVTFRASGTLKP